MAYLSPTETSVVTTGMVMLTPLPCLSSIPQPHRDQCCCDDWDGDVNTLTCLSSIPQPHRDQCCDDWDGDVNTLTCLSSIPQPHRDQCCDDWDGDVNTLTCLSSIPQPHRDQCCDDWDGDVNTLTCLSSIPQPHRDQCCDDWDGDVHPPYLLPVQYTSAPQRPVLWPTGMVMLTPLPACPVSAPQRPVLWRLAWWAPTCLSSPTEASVVTTGMVMLHTLTCLSSIPQPHRDKCCDDWDGDVNTLTCLSSISGRSCHQYHFCRNKRLFVVTKHVMAKVCLTQTKICLWRNVGRASNNLVTTKVLSRQAYFCQRETWFVVASNTFVMTNTRLCFVSHDKKWYLWQLPRKW